MKKNFDCNSQFIYDLLHIIHHEQLHEYITKSIIYHPANSWCNKGHIGSNSSTLGNSSNRYGVRKTAPF